MAVVVTEIRKRRYVCGLLWQSLSNPRELRGEAVELARKMNVDLMVLRKDLGIAQAGYASSREGAQPGMLSLGAVVASVMSVRGLKDNGRRQPANSWLAALRLDEERWAYFAVRDDSFLPSGDYAGSRAEVLDRLYADYGLGGWNAVIGDADLEDQGFHNFEAVTLDDFLPRSKGQRLWLSQAWELKPVERSRRRMVVAAGAVAAGAAVIGLVHWQRQQAAEQQLAAERSRIAQQRQAQAVAEANQKPEPPWLRQPVPRELVRACAGQLDLMSPGGWRLEEYTCSATQATHVWARGDSSVGYLLEQQPQASVELSGERASLVQPLPSSGGWNEELLASRQLLQPLISRFQQLGLRIALKPVAVPAAAPSTLAGLRQKAPQLPDWKAYSFTLQAGGVPLTDIASVLSQPGIRLDRLAYRQGDWFLEGVAYAK
ncbi:type 4b pilus protein PilO2 [Roseateles sp. SL47]|uniref:type 4b pilus protein PilO2 n=1 Tax=Roseateles sp. SL47 TaxID=2995138 RepID=UPI0022710599|nr:type 4b pilus protein PilO2 [Roseateles sp. SL47]WAC74558.1 type 4b pilus protein PilO2 [Roseateles sp. SL47]